MLAPAAAPPGRPRVFPQAEKTNPGGSNLMREVIARPNRHRVKHSAHVLCPIAGHAEVLSPGVLAFAVPLPSGYAGPVHMYVWGVGRDYEAVVDVHWRMFAAIFAIEATIHCLAATRPPTIGSNVYPATFTFATALAAFLLTRCARRRRWRFRRGRRRRRPVDARRRRRVDGRRAVAPNVKCDHSQLFVLLASGVAFQSVASIRTLKLLPG